MLLHLRLITLHGVRSKTCKKMNRQANIKNASLTGRTRFNADNNHASGYLGSLRSDYGTERGRHRACN